MVLTGLDRASRRLPARWRGLRAGLICHQASVTRALQPAPEALRRAGLRLAALFAPEHGLHGALQDQVAVSFGKSGIPHHSLYGDPADPSQFSRLSPSPGALKGLGLLLFDLQDVGVRYYTFVWTMALAMAACARAGVRFAVLDRPNPLGGVKTEGNLPDTAFLSFVGLHPVPVRHGLTAGELALYLNGTLRLGAGLEVVPMTGWRRDLWFEETGLPWVAPSPNMPTPDTAVVYAGGCLYEGTNLSEGRGTTRPFELVGAPYVDGSRLASALRAERLPGAVFRPCVFRPAFHKWAGRDCGGVQVHVADRRTFDAFRTGLAVVRAARRLHPRDFRWKEPPYEFVTDRLPFDLLCGTDAVRKKLEAGASLRPLEAAWRADRARFRRAAAPFLLYR
jgi:uncharacterized protein YbbC (DUF1343 family)